MLNALPRPPAMPPTPHVPAPVAHARPIEPRAKVGYVVKRYPRYSETFIVTEILSHESAGLPIDIFALAPPQESHFQDCIARVRAPVQYLTADGAGSGRASDLWSTVNRAAAVFPDLWQALPHAHGEAGRDVHQALLLALAVRERGVSHLHAHFATSATSVARMAACFAGIPFTFTAHAKDIYHQSVNDEDLRRKLASAAAVVTVSDHNLRFLRERFGEAAAGVVRIYNGLDLSRLAFSDPAERRHIIMAGGRLVEKKGFHVLLDACAILARQGADFRCRIVGSGEAEPALREQWQRLGLMGHVEFLGPRPQEQVFRLMQEAAVFAAPCVVGGDGNRDGLPTVLLEAMALGTPCVSTDVTGIPELVEHERTGLIVPQNDPERLAAALLRLLDGPHLRTRLAMSARQRVEMDFDTHRNTARLREVFAECVKRAPVQKAGAEG